MAHSTFYRINSRVKKLCNILALYKLVFVHWAITATVAHDVLKELFVGDVVKFAGGP